MDEVSQTRAEIRRSGTEGTFAQIVWRRIKGHPAARAAAGVARHGLPALLAVGVLTLLGHPAPPDPPHIDEEDHPPRAEVVDPPPVVPNPGEITPGQIPPNP